MKKTKKTGQQQTYAKEITKGNSLNRKEMKIVETTNQTCK